MYWTFIIQRPKLEGGHEDKKEAIYVEADGFPGAIIEVVRQYGQGVHIVKAGGVFSEIPEA